MKKKITGFHLDDENHWVAELFCGHHQHVRHRPPFEERFWVLQKNSRETRIGSELNCKICDELLLHNESQQKNT